MELQLLVFFCLLLSVLSFQVVYPGNDDQQDSRSNIYIALIMGFGYNNSFNGSGTVPAIQLAVDLINNRTDFLPGYKLNYVLMDSKVSCYNNVHVDLLMYLREYTCIYSGLVHTMYKNINVGISMEAILDL